jgi:ABC-type Mn2+/Zn2+ transport system permease subunit
VDAIRRRRARQDVVTALVLVLVLGTVALFLSFSTEYAETTYSLLLGEVFGSARMCWHRSRPSAPSASR